MLLGNNAKLFKYLMIYTICHDFMLLQYNTTALF